MKASGNCSHQVEHAVAKINIANYVPEPRVFPRWGLAACAQGQLWSGAAVGPGVRALGKELGEKRLREAFLASCSSLHKRCF